MKRGWKQNAGFTLIELIVVIAIIGVLGGVAVPAYSGYVKKADMQSDVTLISEIEKTLTLAGYSGVFAEGEGGYMILSAKEPYTSASTNGNTKLDETLKAAFGENYSLQLAYDGWGSNGLYDNLTPAAATAVKGSSYMTGIRANDLLKDVEIMTGMADNLVTALTSGGFAEGTTLSSMFTTVDDGCVMDATAAKYGITKDANETWEQWAAKDNGKNQTAYSNLLVLTAADESEKLMTAINSDNSGDEYTMSGASNMILEFSSFYAYAATNAEFSATLDKYMAHLDGETDAVPGLAPVTDASTGYDWYNALKAAAGPGYDDYLAEEQAFTDQAAFLSIMAGLGNPSEEQAKQVAADLNNANLFTSGVVNGMYNDFLDGVDALGGMADANINDETLDLGAGKVAILYAYRSGEIKVGISAPTV